LNWDMIFSVLKRDFRLLLGEFQTPLMDRLEPAESALVDVS
jgi:hypothetical protein